MNHYLKKQQQDLPANAENNATDDSFNFELWARAVRPQLLAALQKRTTSTKR